MGAVNVDQAKPAVKVPVSERALIARINRKLAAKDREKQFHRSYEGSRAFAALGRYYIAAGDVVIDYALNIEQVARDLKVLAPYEQVDG
jgi:hypothetical protein